MNIEEYLTPSLKGATEDQLRKVGIASLGSSLPFLQTQKSDELAKWMQELGISENRDFDRKMFKYIVNWVERYDTYVVQKKSPVLKNGLTLDYPKSQVTIEEIVNKAKQFRV